MFLRSIKDYILLARTQLWRGGKKSSHFNRKLEFYRKRLHVVPKQTGRNTRFSRHKMPTVNALQKQNLDSGTSGCFLGSSSCLFLPPGREPCWLLTSGPGHLIYTRFFSVTARDIKKQRETLSCSFSWSGLCTSVERETEISDRGEMEGAVWTPVTNHLFLSSYCKVVKTSSIQTSLPGNGAAVYR